MVIGYMILLILVRTCHNQTRGWTTLPQGRPFISVLIATGTLEDLNASKTEHFGSSASNLVKLGVELRKLGVELGEARRRTPEARRSA